MGRLPLPLPRLYWGTVSALILGAAPLKLKQEEVMKILKIVVEVVEGQKLTLTGEQLEEQQGLKRDIIDKLAKMDGAKCEKEKIMAGPDNIGG
jgi:hypothetical protein